MGKGDRRTKRGKLWRGTHGKTRPKPRRKRKHRGPAASARAEHQPAT